MLVTTNGCYTDGPLGVDPSAQHCRTQDKDQAHAERHCVPRVPQVVESHRARHEACGSRRPLGKHSQQREGYLWRGDTQNSMAIT